MALLGEKLGIGSRGEIELVEGVLNDGEITGDVGLVNGLKRGWTRDRRK